MNKVFDRGYNVITSYRNSKNYDTNWITSGYSLWFIREAKYLNNPRMMLKTSCAVSGTGFLVNSSIIKKNNGWKFNLLTEDIQFSVVNILEGEKIGYCESAMFYDEQPTTFKQSWNQRMRWSKGFYQVMFRYGRELIAMMFKKREMFVSCYDMFMTLPCYTAFNRMYFTESDFPCIRCNGRTYVTKDSAGNIRLYCFCRCKLLSADVLNWIYYFSNRME